VQLAAVAGCVVRMKTNMSNGMVSHRRSLFMVTGSFCCLWEGGGNGRCPSSSRKTAVCPYAQLNWTVVNFPHLDCHIAPSKTHHLTHPFY
jgi:hypothetical protein